MEGRLIEVRLYTYYKYTLFDIIYQQLTCKPTKYFIEEGVAMYMDSLQPDLAIK